MYSSIPGRTIHRTLNILEMNRYVISLSKYEVGHLVVLV